MMKRTVKGAPLLLNVFSHDRSMPPVVEPEG
jgi:hypothetical protein